jgi:hypothetical protein
MYNTDVAFIICIIVLAIAISAFFAVEWCPNLILGEEEDDAD